MPPKRIARRDNLLEVAEAFEFVRSVESSERAVKPRKWRLHRKVREKKGPWR